MASICSGHWRHESIAMFSLTIYAPAPLLASTNCADSVARLQQQAEWLLTWRAGSAHSMHNPFAIRDSFIENTFLNSIGLQAMRGLLFLTELCAPNRASNWA